MKKRLILFCLILLPFLPARAQEIVVKLGKSPVPIDEYFTISVTLKNQQLKTIGKFPEIEGFEKSNRFSSTQTNTVNGQVSSVEQTITQNYAALKEGEFPIKPFSIEVNGRKIESKGGTVKVGPPATKAAPPLQGFGLLDDLFGKQKPQEYIDKKEDAFLAFSTGKDEIFAGEGLPVNYLFIILLLFNIQSLDLNIQFPFIQFSLSTFNCKCLCPKEFTRNMKPIAVLLPPSKNLWNAGSS